MKRRAKKYILELRLRARLLLKAPRSLAVMSARFAATPSRLNTSTRVSSRRITVVASASKAQRVETNRRAFGINIFSLASAVALVPIGASEAREDVVECFFDVAVEGEQLGTVRVEVDASTLSGKRFAQLCRGERGLSYLRTTLDSIEVDDDETEVYLKNGGVQNFVTPGTQSPVDIVGGPSAERLLEDLERQRAKHDRAGLVSLIVRRDPSEPVPEPKSRLVSVRGKFETVYYQPPPPPNGTAFVITLRPAPELDATNVIVGRIVGGEDVLKEISQLPTVKDNTSSQFLAVAKSIGDKRALVAEQAFRKPFKKVIFSKSGVVESEQSSEE